MVTLPDAAKTVPTLSKPVQIGLSFWRVVVLLGFRSDGFSFYWAEAFGKLTIAFTIGRSFTAPNGSLQFAAIRDNQHLADTLPNGPSGKNHLGLMLIHTPRQTRQNCLVCVASASVVWIGFATTQDCRRQKIKSEHVHSNRPRNTTQTGPSCVWCELSWTDRPTSAFCVCRAVLTNGHTGHVPRAPGFFFLFEGPPTGCGEIIVRETR